MKVYSSYSLGLEVTDPKRMRLDHLGVEAIGASLLDSLKRPAAPE